MPTNQSRGSALECESITVITGFAKCAVCLRDTWSRRFTTSSLERSAVKLSSGQKIIASWCAGLAI